MQPASDPTFEIIDARGHRCPVPTLKLRRRLAELPALARIALLADDPMAQIDVPHFCNQNNYVLVRVETLGDGWRFEIERAS